MSPHIRTARRNPPRALQKDNGILGISGPAGASMARVFAAPGMEEHTVPANRQDTAQTFPAGAPDPCRPAYLLQATLPASKRWQNHHARRALILAAARRLISDAGLEGVCLHSIAKSCGISVPTIYNIVGNRAHVLDESSAEWVHWLALSARSNAPAEGQLLAILLAFWNSALRFPQYTMKAVRNSVMPGLPLHRAFRDAGSLAILDLLAILKSQNLLRGSVDIESFAWHVTQSVHAGVCDWCLAPYESLRFERNFTEGPGLMLLGALRGQAARRIEQALDA